METYFQTGIGVAVSVLLFFVTYRQTIGARRQRAILANAEVHRAVLRRMVLENYQPTLADMERLARGKARYHRVPFDLMDSAGESLTDVYAAIFDNDLIPAQDRDNLQKRVVDALERMPDPTKERLTRQPNRRLAPQMYVATVVASASVVGAIATLLASVLQRGTISSETIMLTAVVFVASVAVTTAAVALRQVRERTEAVRQPSDDSAVQVFREVRRQLQASGFSYQTFVGKGSPNNFDFVVTIGDHRVAVETFEMLEEGRARHEAGRLLPLLKELADELWIVTRGGVDKTARGPLTNEPAVVLLSLSEFGARLAGLKSRAVPKDAVSG